MVRARLLSMDLLITAAFAVVAAIALSQSLEWPFRAGLFPMATSAVLLGVSLLKLVLDIAWPPQAKVAAPTKIEDEEEDSEAELVDVFATATAHEWLHAIGWMASFFAALWLLGALVAVPLFAVVYLRVVSRASVTVIAGYAFVAWAFVYLLFIRLLHIPLPAGVVWGTAG